MTRTDEATMMIDASSVRVYRALTNPEALERWLPPGRMTGRVESYDLREGGVSRIVLRYDGDEAGKSGDGTDVVEGTFVEVTPGVRIVQEVDFVSDDPAFAGTMRMTWEVTARGAASEVVFRAEDVPAGISAEDHRAGLEASLRNLAEYVGG
ncbi:SRPBCC domain-containing protein [Microbacterium sp. KUDC0406]|uniref:SRPBCC domain-containing protein n=1 Tax=Microbacterium sp. KUDC0406 TaxID=2909588 RepID=UPI001F3183C5|nr:SRPBCC domain-containing protein [Microbacterium sp. KUDC0406]UJP10146.1 SRPBCC domain-containing protein [Microbacterium sp. KUDC0406]